jgi:hypothetical protein
MTYLKEMKPLGKFSKTKIISIRSFLGSFANSALLNFNKPTYFGVGFLISREAGLFKVSFGSYDTQG